MPAYESAEIFPGLKSMDSNSSKKAISRTLSCNCLYSDVNKTEFVRPRPRLPEVDKGTWWI